MSHRSAATRLGLRRLFAILDTNGDGKIDLQELTDGLRIFGFKPAGIQEFLEFADLDRDQEISFEEYRKAFHIQEDPNETTEEQKRSNVLLALFHELDVDKDGRISTEEWEKGMELLKVDNKYRETLRHHLDLNDDGVITLREFKVGMGLVEDPIDWRKVFDALDHSKTGEITTEEIKTIFDRLDIPMVSAGIVEWIAECDTNKNGTLDYEEFLKFVRAEATRSS
ncbi:hypothetical protein CRM22_006021 [Opisthorchis felineus]|uniref:EF-hand domain-containing protein n=1 Tax=Opisthorchis felineus TaxID=147828 RepID=A0A4S2LV55_OPIFE|nr:hypothetical protein CRM22_006021 [Opisthorchis felineus]